MTDIVDLLRVDGHHNAERNKAANIIETLEADARIKAANLELALARVAELEGAIQTAYGYLWCENNEPGTPIALYPTEKAAYEARKVLRDLLTTEQRGIGINSVLPIVRGNSKDHHD